jgi:O-antigen/teichoic acid export membrane protein
MIRSIFSNWVGMAVGAVVAFLMTPILIHRLGDFHYGMWVLVASMLDYYGLLDIGIRTTLQRYTARYRGSNEKEELNRTFATVMAFSSCIAGFIVLLTLLLARVVPPFFKVSGSELSILSKVIILLGLGLALSFLNEVMGAYLCGLQRFDIFNAAGITTTLVRSGLLIAALHWGYGIIGCSIASLGVSVISLPFYWSLLRLADPHASIDVRKASWSKLRELSNFGFYVFVTQVGDLLRTRVDSLVIARYLTLALVTPYNVAARLITFFRYTILIFTGPLMTEMSALEGQADGKKLPQMFLRWTKMTLLMSILIASYLVLNGRELLTLWVGKQYIYLGSFSVLVALVIGRAAAVVQTPSAALLLARGRNRALAIWTVCEGIANLGLSIYWARKYGILGVALGTMVPLLVSKAIIQPWYTLWVVKVSLRAYITKALLRPIMVLGCFLLVTRFISTMFTEVNLTTFALKTIWEVVFFVLLAVLIGFTPVERHSIWQRARSLATSRKLAWSGE